MSELSLDTVYSEEVAETEPVTPEVTAEATEPETQEAEVTQEAKEPEAETTDAKKESWTFSQAMDEREKRKEAVSRAEGLQAELDALQDPEKRASVFDDESKFREELKEETQAELHNAMLGMSKSYAERELGKDVVEAASKWYAEEGTKSPYMVDQIHESELKFHKVVELYNNEKDRLDPDAYRAKLKAEILAELKSEEPGTPEKSITPSLASKRSSGKDTNSTESFEDLLGD
jgi:hypothetical protein